MNVHHLSRYDFLSLCARSQRVSDAYTQAHPFSSPASLLPFTQLVCDARSKVIVVSTNDTPTLENSLLLESPRIGPRRYKSFNNYYTNDFLLPNPNIVCADSAVKKLSALAKPPSSVVLSPLKDNATTGRYLEAFNQGHWRCQQFEVGANWYLPSEGLRYEPYVQMLKSRGGNPVRRKTRAFFKNPLHRVEIVTDLRTHPGIELVYHDVYKKSWHNHESHPQYISAWMRACSERGWLRLGIAWVDAQPVAVQFWFKIGNKAFIYKMAYDPVYADLSPGTVLSGEMFQYALDIDRVHEIDFLSGDDAYKSSWVTHRRPLVGLEAFNLRTLAGSARWMVHNGARSFKKARSRVLMPA